MRSIGGSAGGVLLKAPKGFAVRPTPDLVRQAVFNSLGPRVQRARVLELFAGTGALSLECLSRGAVLALCVEKSGRHAQFIHRNLEQARLPPQSLHLRVRPVGQGQVRPRAVHDPFPLSSAAVRPCRRV